MRPSVQFRAARPSTRVVRMVTVELADANHWPRGGLREVQVHLQTAVRTSSMLYGSYRLEPTGSPRMFTPIENMVSPTFDTEDIILICAAADQMRLPRSVPLRAKLFSAISVAKLVARLLPVEEVLLSTQQAVELLLRQVVMPFGLSLRRYSDALRAAAG